MPCALQGSYRVQSPGFPKTVYFVQISLLTVGTTSSVQFSSRLWALNLFQELVSVPLKRPFRIFARSSRTFSHTQSSSSYSCCISLSRNSFCVCCFQSLAGQRGGTVYPLLRLIHRFLAQSSTTIAWSVWASDWVEVPATFWFGI